MLIWIIKGNGQLAMLKVVASACRSYGSFLIKHSIVWNHSSAKIAKRSLAARYITSRCAQRLWLSWGFQANQLLIWSQQTTSTLSLNRTQRSESFTAGVWSFVLLAFADDSTIIGDSKNCWCIGQHFPAIICCNYSRYKTYYACWAC